MTKNSFAKLVASSVLFCFFLAGGLLMASAWSGQANMVGNNIGVDVVYAGDDDPFAPVNPGNLPTFEGATGTAQIVSGINLISDWVRNVLGAIAVLILIYGGVMYVTARGETAQIDKAKNTLLYAVIGLAVVILADQIKDIFYPETPPATAGEYATQSAQQASEMVRGAIAFIEGFVATIATAMLIYGGFLYLTARGETTVMDKAKNTVQYSVIGLFLVSMADYLVRNVFYPESRALGQEQVSAGIKAVEGAINFALGFVATIAVAFIIYAGFLMLTAMGDPAKNQKAATIIKGAVIGLMLIMISYALVGIVLGA